MSHEVRRGSLVALTFVLAGCSTSRDAGRELARPVTDIPRTAPSAREQALKSIGREAPAPHLSSVMPRQDVEAQAMQSEAARAPDFHGLALTTPMRFEPMPASPAAAAAAPAAVAAAPAAAAAAPAPWLGGGPWRNWTGAAQGQAQATTEPSPAEEPPRQNDGQDPLRPLRRLELRFAYTKLQPDGTPGTLADGSYGVIDGPRQEYRQGVTTLRLDLPTGFPKRWIIHDWKLATTIEVPWVSTDVPGPDGSDDRETGLGDASAQMIMIPTAPGRFEWGFGAKGTFPTAREEQMGTGRWLVSPTAIFMWHPEWMRNDGFFGVTLRDTFDTGLPDDRAEVHYATIQPQFQWNLGRKWFIATAPEILWDFRHDDSWYVPADLMIGTLLGDRWLLSLDGKYAITNHTEGADWTVEARLAWFF
jgi:hypothetical protein